jgi:hypothetical protein
MQIASLLRSPRHDAATIFIRPMLYLGWVPDRAHVGASRELRIGAKHAAHAAQHGRAGVTPNQLNCRFVSYRPANRHF